MSKNNPVKIAYQNAKDLIDNGAMDYRILNTSGYSFLKKKYK